MFKCTVCWFKHRSLSLKLSSLLWQSFVRHHSKCSLLLSWNTVPCGLSALQQQGQHFNAGNIMFSAPSSAHSVCMMHRVIVLFLFFHLSFLLTPTLLVSAGEWMFVLLGFLFPYIFFAFFFLCVFSGLCNKRWRDFPKASRPVGCSLPLCGAHEHTHAF